MLDAKQLLGNIDSNGLIGKMIGGMGTKNFAAGLLTGGVATSLLGGKDTLESAAKVGGLALLGTLAYKAYGNYQQGKAQAGSTGVAAPSVLDAVKQAGGQMAQQASALASSAKQAIHQATATSTPQATQPQVRPEFTLAVLRAMIGAAKADGQVDDVETQKIMGHLEQQGLSADEKMLVVREMGNTPDVAQIASAAQSPEETAQIYLAALIVCDVTCIAEQAYLANLAQALKLDAGFAQQLQLELQSAQSSQAA